MKNTIRLTVETFETRSESNETVDKQKRYRQIEEILKGKEMTAKQIAVEMKKRGYSTTDERNLSAPRITEMLRNGKAEIVGKVRCEYTGKTVCAFRLIDDNL